MSNCASPRHSTLIFSTVGSKRLIKKILRSPRRQIPPENSPSSHRNSTLSWLTTSSSLSRNSAFFIGSEVRWAPSRYCSSAQCHLIIFDSWCVVIGDTAKARVGQAGIRAGLHARARPIACAVALVAEERSAALDALRNMRLLRIEAVVRTLRIHDGVLTGPAWVGVGPVPVLRPLPHIARDVVQPIAAGLKRLDRCRREVAVSRDILVREASLPGIGMLRGNLVIAPGVGLPVQPAAGRVLPFGLSRQPLPCPLAVCARVVPGDMNHRMGALFPGWSSQAGWDVANRPPVSRPTTRLSCAAAPAARAG